MKTNMPITDIEQKMDAGQILVSKTDLKGAITYANQPFIDISGFTESELIGTNHNIVRHPDMPTEAFEDLWRTLKAGKPWQGIVKNRCKNGDFYWVKAKVTPVRKDGEVVEFMSVRYEPSQEEVSDAEAAYVKLKEGTLKIKNGNLSNNHH